MSPTQQQLLYDHTHTRTHRHTHRQCHHFVSGLTGLFVETLCRSFTAPGAWKCSHDGHKSIWQLCTDTPGSLLKPIPQWSPGDGLGLVLKAAWRRWSQRSAKIRSAHSWGGGDANVHTKRSVLSGRAAEWLQGPCGDMRVYTSPQLSVSDRRLGLSVLGEVPLWCCRISIVVCCDEAIPTMSVGGCQKFFRKIVIDFGPCKDELFDVTCREYLGLRWLNLHPALWQKEKNKIFI